jgi:uncharacterized membrane protein YkoI
MTAGWKDVLKQMDAAKLTPASAVAAAEAHSKGKALGVMGAVKDNKLGITVHCVVDGKCKAVTVDNTGKATDVKDATSGCKGCADSLKAMEGGKVTLASAIKAAEEHSKGKAIAAMAETAAGATNIMVACAVGDKAVIVTVDGKTGKATKMEDDKAATPPIKGG